ncbi:glucose-6-phosphate isomerase [Halarchaeum acidiphilum MH1-52-1]|uniref:Probable glucose-6-phosphate isomerase n=1 Tax=Halarchaeum acidiphilum MH1-52-1 TaxID=1261545 RepID=U2YT98_9EURY|nr:glucose-6-phosphate isomerase [Halarchaeum acidiphilum]GAD52235.1 glucose-6-phosphate isomerase [Halarchaeum acidiphilum MH1-52-1]
MDVDIGNALASAASPGVPRSYLDRLDARVADAHERIERGMADGEFGYAALNLPERVDTGAIRDAVAPLDGAEAVLTVGIGGSALGAATLTDALDTEGEAYYLDNVDPAQVSDLLDDLDLESTAVNVVSRSGTTAETLANFLVVRDAYEARDVDWTERTLVTTGESGNLRDLADEHDLPVLPVPEGVPGRFSALSTVGLAPAAILGVDVETVVEGARRERESLAGSLYETPAYAYGAIAYALDARGANANVAMPYHESLETYAEWYAQLHAESLGKDGLGQTPVRALGATDQHSQLQLYRAGPNDKLVTFVRARDGPDVPIPEADLDGLDYLADSTLGGLRDAEFEATEASLADVGLPNVRVTIDRVDAASVGGLLYGMEAAVVLAGELYDVETFTQPAVEWGKEVARDLLRGADALDEKETLRVTRE